MTKQGWIIYNKQDADKNRSYIHWFIDECQQQGLTLQLVLREQLTIGIFNHQLTISMDDNRIACPNFVVMRTIDPLLSQQLERLGVKVFNSSKVATICNNKAFTYQAISSLNIPIVDSLFINKDSLTNRVPMQFPFVVKTLSGRSGNNVAMISSYDQWLTYISQPPKDDLVAQACDVQIGKDVRVYVIGKQIVGAALRESDQDFRANYSLGGSASWYELSEQERSTVQTIIEAFDFDLVGIDFLFAHDGSLLFNEIEDVVGSRMLSAISDINIVKQYVVWIKAKLDK